MFQKSGVFMKGIWAVAILFFFYQQAVSQTNPFSQNKSFKLLPDSTAANLLKHLKGDSLVVTQQNAFGNNSLNGFYNNMPVAKPDPSFTDIMPHYSLPPDYYSNMPCVPFIYENEKQIPSSKKVKK